MSRYIGEPTTQRQVSSLQYGQNQLYRRPPVPGPGLATFRARQVLEFTDTGPGSAVEELWWDEWENGNTDVFHAELDTGPGTRLRIVNFLRQGWYTINLDIGWDNDFDNVDVVTDFSDGWDLPTIDYWHRRSGYSNVDHAWTHTVSYPLFMPQLATPTGFPSGGIFANTLYQVGQFSGVLQSTFVGTELEILYHGPIRNLVLWNTAI